MGRDGPIFEDLVKKVIFSVVSEFWVKRDIEQSVRAALAEDSVREICEHGPLLTYLVLFHTPNDSLLMQDEKQIAAAGDLVERGQPRLHPGAREFKAIGQEWQDPNRSREFRDVAGHA